MAEPLRNLHKFLGEKVRLDKMGLKLYISYTIHDKVILYSYRLLTGKSNVGIYSKKLSLISILLIWVPFGYP